MPDISAAASAKSAAPKKSASPKRALKSATKPATQPTAKATKAKAIKVVEPTKTKPAAPAPSVKTATKPANEAAAPKAAAQSGQVQAKQKLVRDSFTMPSNDFGLIYTLKERTLSFRRPTKKSELLRAGLHALVALNDAKLRSVLEGLAPLKSGRPKKAD